MSVHRGLDSHSLDAAALADPGFADRRSAQIAVRRMKLRLLLIGMMQSVSATLDLLDKSGEPHGRDSAPLLEQTVGLTRRNLDGRIDRVPVDSIKSDELREQELLQGVDLILELLDSLGVGIEQGLFSLAGGRERNQPANAAHRLSGAAK